MSKNDTSPTAGVVLFSELALALADSGDGFENFDWGRMGLVSRRRQPSNGPCTPPIDRNRAEKIFQFEHEIFHSCCQLIGAGFMFHVKHLAINISKHFTFWHVSCMGMWVSRLKMLDICCQNSTFVASGVNGWIDWDFYVLSKLSRHLLPVQISCQISPKIFFHQFLNDFNRLQKFSRGSDFGTGHAITYHERERNLPFMGGSAGQPIIGHVQCSMRQSLTYVSIRLGICGNH